MTLSKIVTRIGEIYLWLAALFIVFGYGCIIWFEGWWKFTDIVSPFNLVNFFAVVLTLLPGLGLIKLGTHLANLAKKKGDTASSARKRPL
jgi:hypothetical protein